MTLPTEQGKNRFQTFQSRFAFMQITLYSITYLFGSSKWLFPADCSILIYDSKNRSSLWGS